jgi:hypothetical protein
MLWGLENGLIAMGFVPGMGRYTIITELIIGSLGQLVDFPTAIQCKVFE